MQQDVVALPACHPVVVHGTVREGLAARPGRALVTGMVATPVEAQGAGVRLLDD